MRFHQIVEGMHGMDDGTVVSSSEVVADRLQEMVGKFLGKIHRHLAGSHYFLFSGRGLQVFQFDTKIIGAVLLDKVYPNFRINVLHDIFHDVLGQVQIDLGPVEEAFATNEINTPSSSRTLVSTV